MMKIDCRTDGRADPVGVKLALTRSREPRHGILFYRSRLHGKQQKNLPTESFPGSVKAAVQVLTA